MATTTEKLKSESENRRRYKRQWEADDRRTAAEVPEIPPPKDPARREACGESLELALATYFPDSTGLTPFSPDHKRVIGRMERCLRVGGRQANCVYRGFAKTTITENAALWAALYGYRSCILMLGASDPSASLLMESIKSELQSNELLAEDFPEVCLPIACLENKPQRCASQIYQPTGERTFIRFSASYVAFPNIDVPWNKASGAVLLTRGITSAARGISVKHPTGRKLRPDFAIADDIQTDDSAKSATDVASRLSILRRGILKSSSHQKAMACVVNGTVIRPNDVMDQICNRELNPAWETERVPMVRKWSDANDTLWQEYRKRRHGFDPEVVGDRERAHVEATSFYLKNREEMDAGCEVSWDSCFDPEVEVSAIQHAYNLYFDDPPDVFETECQQNATDPADESGAPKVLSAGEICKRFNGIPRTVVPHDRDVVTAFIDVHDRLLFWSVMGFQKVGFAGDVVDYGAWPKQPNFYGWTLRNCPAPIGKKYPFRKRLIALEDALDDCIEFLMSRTWKRADGAEMRVERLLIDAGYEPSTVEMSIRKSQYASLIDPSRGRGIGAKDKPMRLYSKKPGEQLSNHWRKFRPVKRTMLWVEADVNHWKSFFHDSLVAKSVRLFGNDPDVHRMFGSHVTAERPTRMESPDHGRKVDEWDLIVKGTDNHLLDDVVGCCVAAAMCGCKAAGEIRDPTRQSKPRKSLEQLAQEARR
jgi:hypothetical protein